MSIDDEAHRRSKDDPLHPDNLPGNIAHILYDGPDTGQPKEHEANIDLEYERNKKEYHKEEYHQDLE